MKKVNELWDQVLNILKLDHISWIFGHKCQTFQTCLSGKLIVESLSKNHDNLVNLILLEQLMGHSQKLSHWVNTVLFDFLIDILLLKLIHDSSINIFGYTLMLLNEHSTLILELNDKFARNF